eukprot:5325791-Pyramimonas_sp.AAC.1
MLPACEAGHAWPACRRAFGRGGGGSVRGTWVSWQQRGNRRTAPTAGSFFSCMPGPQATRAALARGPHASSPLDLLGHCW